MYKIVNMGNKAEILSNNSGNLDAANILVVDDDQDIANLVSSLLNQEGMSAEAYTQPALALEAFQKKAYDLAILDVMMPGMSGFEMCGLMRSTSEIPIIFLSAKDEETDQVVGLTLGADDYVCKPFKPRELVARVKAHLRRAKVASQKSNSSEYLDVGGLVADKASHTATLLDEPLTLTPKEFAILVLLMQHPNRPVSASDIYENVWNETYDISAANTVMVHIRHLREKLAAIDGSKEYIETVWGVGYRLLQSAFEGKSAVDESTVKSNGDTR